MKVNKTTVEPRITNTRLIRRVFFVPGPALTFSLHSTRLMPTTDTYFLPNEQIFVESQPR